MTFKIIEHHNLLKKHINENSDGDISSFIDDLRSISSEDISFKDRVMMAKIYLTLFKEVVNKNHQAETVNESIIPLSINYSSIQVGDDENFYTKFINKINTNNLLIKNLINNSDLIASLIGGDDGKILINTLVEFCGGSRDGVDDGFIKISKNLVSTIKNTLDTDLSFLLDGDQKCIKMIEGMLGSGNDDKNKLYHYLTHAATKDLNAKLSKVCDDNLIYNNIEAVNPKRKVI